MKKVYIIALFLISQSFFAQRDDKGLNFNNRPLPTNLQGIASWELIKDLSDDFNYSSKQNAKFGNTWEEKYNPDPGFVGPGQTRWNVTNSPNFSNDYVKLNNGKLEIRALPGAANPGGRRNFTDRFVNCGIITSKRTISYPVYMEARIQISNLENSSNFWMLNACDNEEIDVLEGYGGAKLRDANGNVTGGDNTFYTTQISTNQHIWHRQGVQDHGGETDNCGGRDLTDFTYQVFFTTDPTGTGVARNWRDDFHTFGVYWGSPTEVTYYIDGVPRFNGSHYVPNRIANGLTGSLADAKLQCPNSDILRCETDALLKDVQGRSSGGSQYPNREFNDPTFIVLDTESHSGRPLESVTNLGNNNLNVMKVDWVRVYRPSFNGSTPTPTPPVVVTPPPAPQPNPTPAPAPAPTNGSATNLALNKAATQSSTLRTINASFANDGNRNNFSHTENNGAAWWEVDLGSVNNISHINVWNREDCCQNRLQAYQIFVSDVPFVSKDIVETANQSGNGVYFQEGTAQRPTRQNIGRTGRYVRIQLSGANFLNIAEVEVFGTPANAAPAPPTNNSNQIVANGLYQISNPFTNQSLLARALENHGARMVDTGNYADQRWNIEHLGNNVYTVRNQGTGRYLEVSSARCTNGALVQTWTNSNGDHKKWRIERNGANYTLKPTHCLSRALDVAAGARDAKVHIWTANRNNNNQKWTIERIFNSNSNAAKIISNNEATTNKVVAFPNPAILGNDFTLEGLTAGNQINILDSTGKLVKQLYADQSTLIVSTSNLNSGLYFISIDYGNDTLKLIVE